MEGFFYFLLGLFALFGMPAIVRWLYEKWQDSRQVNKRSELYKTEDKNSLPSKERKTIELTSSASVVNNIAKLKETEYKKEEPVKEKRKIHVVGVQFDSYKQGCYYYLVDSLYIPLQ